MEILVISVAQILLLLHQIIRSIITICSAQIIIIIIYLSLTIISLMSSLKLHLLSQIQTLHYFLIIIVLQWEYQYFHQINLINHSIQLILSKITIIIIIKTIIICKCLIIMEQTITMATIIT